MLSSLRLKKNEDRRLRAGHLWIYNNEVDTAITPLQQFTIGELVSIENHQKQLMGIGYINPQTLLCGRLLSRDPHCVIDHVFFEKKIKESLQLRERFFDKPFYRLIYSESDGLPGLIVDRFNDVLVIQINTAGMDRLQNIIIDALKNTLNPTTIVLKNESSVRKLEGLECYSKIIYGPDNETLNIEENDTYFQAPLISGQKTGWFFDHRNNRKKLKQYVNNKRVLDVFSYVGGFGVQAAVFGAKEVMCIDSSEKAINYVIENSKLNQVADNITTKVDDAFDALKLLLSHQKQFDVIILDPPAFIKKKKDLEKGVLAYQRLNQLAMQLLSSDGILISCSCSLHLSIEMLVDILRRCSLKTHRNLRILEYGFQGIDHPIHPAIPETHYLKAVFCSLSL